MNYKPPTPDPTRKEIRERCAEIRKSWSAVEHYRRAGQEPARYVVPGGNSGGLRTVLPKRHA